MSDENKKYQSEFDQHKKAGKFFESGNRENPFTVPEGYFDQLHDRIMEKTAESNSVIFPTDHRSFIFRHKVLSLAIAASILLFLAWAIFFPRNETNQERVPQITLQQLLDEKPEYIEDMDEELLIETLLAGNEQTSLNFNLDQNIDADTSITDKQILDYMIEEDMLDDFYENF